MKSDTQFRVLYRQFLFRMVDLDILAPGGDTSKLLGQVAAVLVLVSIWSLIPALGVGGATGLPPGVGLYVVWTAEHFLIATTILVCGLIAVLNWDSTYPDRRDVFVLGPLPVPPRTMFLAKVAAVASALAAAVLALHCVAGLIWPIALHMHAGTQPVPAMVYDPALPPMTADAVRADLDRAFARTHVPGAGAAIGILDHGRRSIFTYGAARPDSIFEIGSISKTFTGLLLARMVIEGTATLREPVRHLLPPGAVPPGSGFPIDLLSLATHRSGLPRMPDNMRPQDRANPAADYRRAGLFAFLAKHGLRKPANAPFEYSNVGYALLGEALAVRAGSTYPALLAREITGPLAMKDTVIMLDSARRERFLAGIDLRGRPAAGWDMDVMASAGGIRSTAPDLLAYLDAQLHPERRPTPLAAAVRLSQKLQADVASGTRIAMAWIHDGDSGAYSHGGGTGGYTCHVFFDPARDQAVVVLLNRNSLTLLPGMIGDRIRQRLAGEPALALDNVVVPDARGWAGAVRMFAAYWLTMLGGGAFVYCFVLALQGVTAQLLPRRWFLKVSSWLQMAVFAGLVGGYLLQPSLVTPGTVLASQNHGALYWSPSYWFLGLFQALNGSPALAPLATRARWGLAVVVTIAAVAYLLSYLRSIRQIAEQPDIVARAGRASWLPRFGEPLTTAITQFSIRTLVRSRQHRLVLAFYAGLALAFVIFTVKSPGVQRQLGAHEDPWFEPNVPLIVASILLLCAAVAGIRVVASLPRELGANWVFRTTPVDTGRAGLAAVRRAFYLLALMPVWTLLAAVLLAVWPWQAAAVHITAMALLGITLAEIALAGFFKMPFACSYVPGNSHANIAMVGYLALIYPVVTVARIEREALRDSTGSLLLLAVLAVMALAARWWTNHHGGPADQTLRFDDAEEPEVVALDLHRDGTAPLRSPPLAQAE